MLFLRLLIGFHPWVGKIPWRGKWRPTPVFLPGESCGQRSLAGCSPQAHRELDTTEATEHTRIQQALIQHLPSFGAPCFLPSFSFFFSVVMAHLPKPL